jgi:hypothetical protein
MGDETLELQILNDRIKKIKIKLLHDQRMEAYKFLSSAYNYVQSRECVAESLDSWEGKLLLGFNHLAGLSRKSDRDELLKQIAETKWIVDQRILSNPTLSDGEQKLFEMVESFKAEV